MKLSFSWIGEPSDPVVVLLHPFPYDSTAYQLVTPLLEDFAMLLPDLPGCGESVESSVYDFDPVADTIADQLRSKGVTKAVVAGISMGGYLALALAERHPDLVAALALIDTKAGAEPESGVASRLEIADKALTEGPGIVAESWRGVLGSYTQEHRPDTVALAQQLLARASGAGISWCQRAIAARPDRIGVLANFAGPVLLFRGDEDPLSTLEQYQEMDSVARNSVFVTAGRVGHLPNLEAPELVAESLRKLISSL